MTDDNDITVRIGNPGDLRVVQELNAGAFENDARHDPYLVMTWPTDPETGAAYFAQRLAGDGVVFVALHNGEVVGYLAGAMQANESYRRGVRSELENMFVRASTRRSGVGTALVDAFRRWSLDQGADEMYVSAYFDNLTAVEFYKHNGFASYSHDLLMDLRAPNATS